ncbi:MAG: 50S ribosomal protein L11 methyltransferase, partial [Bdellovibrionales bacterium]|nr:50S ribosomal protein L11 methyltransferase [Bdellovibrionales bacterium]
MNWKKVTIAGDAILELIAHYDTFGVLGAEQVSDVEVQLYVNAEVYDPQKTAFQKLLKQECLSLTSEEKGENQNWTLQCAELLEPRMLGNLRIVPLHEPQPPKESNENDLFVYVGMGFGTGHHATTQMMIEEVQQLSYSPETVLDVGAGSGILSLAVARCFGSKVCAVESDPDACANAAINLSLNSLEQCIELHQEYYTPTKKK